MKKIKSSMTVMGGLLILGVIYKVWLSEKIMPLFRGGETVEIQHSITVFPPSTENENQNIPLSKNYSEQFVEFGEEATLLISAHLQGDHPDAEIKILVDRVECVTRPAHQSSSIVGELPENGMVCIKKVAKGRHHILAYNNNFKASTDEKVMLRNYILNSENLKQGEP